MTVRRHTKRGVRIDLLESRLLLAGAPLFIDFGQSGTATTYSTMSNAYVAGTSITTPAHQNGGVSNTYNVYNNVSTSNPTSLVWADGTTATGISLNWGRAATSGGTVDFTNATGLSIPTVTGANSNNKEMDNSLYNDVIYATAQDEGVQITGLSPGSYYIYFTNNRVYSTEAPRFFADQVGTNLTQFDSTLAQIGGDFRLDGVFNAPGDYVVAKVTLVAGDKLTLISHSYGGSFDASGVYTPPNNQFNTLEIVPISAGTDATPISPMQSGAYRWAGSQGPTNLDAFQKWIGKSNLWGEDFLAYDSWTSLTDQNHISWLTGPWSSWVAAQSGRRLVLGVAMIPGSGASLATGATGAYNSYFQTLATNLINDGLGNTIIRLGWEFNGGWYPWAANGHQTDFINYWQQIVNTMRSVTVAGKTNNLQFCWNPASGYQQFPSTQAYPGDAYVDYVGEDVYDESYLANTYPFPGGDSDSDIEARREVAIANKFTENYGVNALATFAYSHGKPFSIPEWGVANRADGHGGLDDPLFIQTMHSFISNPGNNVAFNIYFDVKASDGDHELSPGADGLFISQFPDSSSAFRTLFGGQPTAFGSNTDIGAPALAGSGSFNPFTNAWTLTAGGSDIWGTSDQFHYASNSVSGDQVLVARVASLNNPSAWLKAGVMMRDGPAANAAFADVMLTPSNGIIFQYRATAGGSAANVSSITGVSGSAWVKLVKSGNQFYAFYATTTDRPANGDWRPLGQTAISFTNATYQAGLAVTSHNTATLGVVTFTDFGVTPNTLPTGYTATDISGVGKVGMTSDDWANYSLVGSGAGIGGGFDQLQYYSTSVTGSQVLTARLDYLQASTSVSKAGLMFRDSSSSTAINVNLVVTNAGDLIFQKRTTTSGTAATVASIVGFGVPSSSNPIWLRLIRSGTNDFTAYYAQGINNPTTWTQLGSDTIVNFTNSTYLAGLAVSAGNNTVAAAANFFGLTCNVTELGHRISLKSQLTGQYMNLNATDGYFYANAATDTASTAQFDVVSATVGGDYVALRSVSTGLYVFVDTTDSNRLKATATTIASSSQFRWNYLSSTQADFQSPIVNWNFLSAPSTSSAMGFYDATNNFQTRDRYVFTEIS